jgi:hypothetical protein
MNRVSSTDTASFRRDVPYMLGIEANWENRKDADANIKWAKDVYKNMHRFSRGGSYLNFPGFVEDREVLLRGGLRTESGATPGHQGRIRSHEHFSRCIEHRAPSRLTSIASAGIAILDSAKQIL